MSIRAVSLFLSLVLCSFSLAAGTPDFTALDKTVSHLAKQDSLTAVATALAAVSHSDWERARAVYDWVAMNITYDTNAFYHGTPTATDAEGVLTTRTSVCQGYANLYLALATALGVECQMVVGYAKGAGYGNGEHFAATNHAWNVVKLDGIWHLVDSTWGSGSVDESGQWHKAFDSTWFDMNPNAFVLHHLPQDPQWILLGSVVTLREFEKFPFIDVGTLEEMVASGLQGSDILKLSKTYTFSRSDGYSIEALVSMGGTLDQAVAMMQDGAMPLMANGGKFYDVQLLDFPVQGQLKVGSTYRFTLKIHITDFPYFNGKVAFTSFKVYKLLKKSGDTYSGEITIKDTDIGDPINVVMLTRTQDKTEGYQIIGRWSVKR